MLKYKLAVEIVPNAYDINHMIPTMRLDGEDVEVEQRVLIVLSPILESLGTEDASPKSFEQSSPAHRAMVVTGLKGAWMNGRDPINKWLTDEDGNPYSWDKDSSEDGEVRHQTAALLSPRKSANDMMNLHPCP